MTRRVLTLLLAALLLCTVCGCRDVGYRTVMEIGGYDVPYVHYYYLYMNHLSAYREAGYTGEELDTLARKETLIALRHTGAIYSLAKEYDVKLSDAQEESVDAAFQSYRDQYDSSDAFEASLEEEYMTQKFFRDALEMLEMETVLRSYLSEPRTGAILSDDRTVEADIRENFFFARQILLLCTEETREARRAEAENLLGRLRAGEDFDTLQTACDEDPARMTQAEGYCFTEGQLLEPFEAAVRETEVGSLCDHVVESDVGLHIILRLPVEDAYIDAHFSELRDAYLARECNRLLAEREASLTPNYTKYYDTLTMSYLETHRFG